MSSTWTVPAEATLPERHPDARKPGPALEPHWSGCFGCRSKADGGMGTEIIIEDGLGITGIFDVTERFEGGPGVIHGGVLSAAFDEAMGSVSLHLHAPVVTAHLEIDFARPILLGSRLVIRARVVGMVGRKLYTTAEAYIDGDDDTVVATSRALFLTINPQEHFKDSAALSSRL